jgi:uncharacterized phage infection (PIP) family protein YhgE
MKPVIKKKLSFFLLTMLISLTGCATTGDGLSDEALSGDPTAMWADGQRMTIKGESEIQKGSKALEAGRKQIREGESMVQRGNNLVSAVRFEYQSAVKNAGTATTPDAVAAEAKALKVVGSRWEDAIDMIRDGNRLVEKGNKTLDAAQAQVREGRTLVERGSTLMRNSERLRLGEDLLDPATAGVQR